MAETGPSNVNAAFDMLLEEIDREVGVMRGAGHSALDDNNFGQATRLAARANAMKEFGARVASMRKEWATLAAATGAVDKKKDQPSNSGGRGAVPSRLRPGIRTPQDTYYRPILQAISEMGGRARTAQVVSRVGELLKGVLTDEDYRPIPTNPNMIRWRNGAEWARYLLVRQGLMRSDSPRGIWEISDAGRQFLAKGRQ